jgi:hypothetical protein
MAALIFQREEKFSFPLITPAYCVRFILFLKRYPSCYPYIQSIPVKVLVVIEERKTYVKVKDPLSFEIWIILNS